MTEITDGWRNYTLEANGLDPEDLYVVCRDPEMGGSCEWNQPNAHSRYLTVGEALDAAQAHHRWHQANPESCVDGEGDPNWAKLPPATEPTLADLMNLIIPGEWTFGLNGYPNQENTAMTRLIATLASSQGTTHQWIGTDPQTMLHWAVRRFNGGPGDRSTITEDGQTRINYAYAGLKCHKCGSSV
jgi:hypothetical protein